MAIAWFLVPYVRRSGGAPSVYVAIDDFTQQIEGEGGTWSETEVLGGKAIVKVRASAATLNQLDDLYYRIPVNALDTTLSGLTTAQRNRLHQEINALGYDDTELTSILGNFNNIGNKTLGQVLNFIARRRQQPRYNQATDTVVWDGSIVTPRPVSEVDDAVANS